MVGFVVQLRVERHHAAVRVLQLGVEPHQLVLPPAQLLEHPQQLLVLLLHLLHGVAWRLLRQRIGDPGGGSRRHHVGAPRHELSQDHARAAARRRVDVERVHEALGADDAEAHARGGLVPAAQDRVELGDAGPAIPDADGEDLGPRLAFHGEVDPPTAAVADGVARDLGHRGGDPCLILRVEAEQRGQLAGALAAADDIVLARHGHGQQRQAHAASSLQTTTVASSRPRVKSR